MHVHGTQMNPYAALDALRSAQKTAAKRQAELVRKELLESASEKPANPTSAMPAWSSSNRGKNPRGSHGVAIT